MPEPPNPLARAAFLTTCDDLAQLPPDARAEVAFVGRSNSGKSSAINTLAGRNRLAFVSKQPGRTQHINYFALGDGRFLVDLPGYGFARAPQAARAHWGRLVAGYIAGRSQLSGLVLLMDARHPLKDLDLQLLDWFAPSGRPVHLLLTKSDKLTRQAAANTLRSVRFTLGQGYPNATAQLFSSLTKQGIEEAREAVGRLLATQKNTPGQGGAGGNMP